MRAVGSQDENKVAKYCTDSDKICLKNFIGNTAIHVAAKVCNPVIFHFLKSKKPTCLNSKTFWTRRTAYELVSRCNTNYGMCHGVFD